MNIRDAFTCPQCGGHEIQSVTTASTVIQEIYEVEDFGISCTGDTYAEDSDTPVFQCANCGYEIPDVHNGEVLFKFLAGASKTPKNN